MKTQLHKLCQVYLIKRLILKIFLLISKFIGFISFEFEPVGKWFEFYNFQKHQGDVVVEEDEGICLFI